MIDFHFLRPWWLLAILPILYLFWSLWRHNPRAEAWAAVCDSHLLKHLMQEKGQSRRHFALLSLFLSSLSMVIALAGPTWSRLPVPSYKQIQPRVLVLDVSNEMLANDLAPDRLTRAKFKLHDLFKHRDEGQFALIAYTGEPFVVSPLTDDAQTIASLLSSLSPDIMPVEGQDLGAALEEAGKLIENAGFKQGQILVLTGSIPDLAAIQMAKVLADKQIDTSIMPILANKILSPSFQDLAVAGQGRLLTFTDTSTDLEQWLRSSVKEEKFALSKEDNIPVWRDQGRWFLIPTMLLLLPVFRRGWLQRITA